MTGIMDEAQRLLKVGGRLVVTAVTMETGYTILKELKGRPFTYEVTKCPSAVTARLVPIIC